MPVLQLDDKQFPLKAGANRIGAGADADIAVPGQSAAGIHAVIEGGASPTIRRADDAAQVRLNGVLLGAEPTPLIHGDKVEIAGQELRYADDAQGGATQFVSASEIAALTGAKRSGAARATAASGGRLVSLVDGKEYSVADTGIVFGRDASCDIVVAQNEVSRRHAEIVPGEQGYLLRDTSANGVFVNGERVQGSHRLARADVLRIGTEEFRFYADVLPSASGGAVLVPPVVPLGVVPPTAPPRPPAPSVPVAPPAPPAPVAAAAPSAGILDMDLIPAVPAAAAVPPARAPAAPAPPAPPPAAVTPPAPVRPAAPSTPVSTPAVRDARPVTAILEAMNEGPGKGMKYELRTPLGHIGRGAHNDVRLQDESVSETHAKLQKREDGWYVVDMDSTNGTYVGGHRVIGERRIEGSPDVRFGGMKFRFTTVGAGSAADLEAKGTRAIAMINRPSTLPATHATPNTPPGRPPAPTPPANAPEKSGSGVPSWVWIVVVLVIIGVAFFVLRGRA